MTLENNRAPLLCYFKLCTSFGSHWWIKTIVTVRKCLICVKNVNFVSRVTLKFNRWPWKTIRHLSYATWGFLHHFIIICEINLELQSGDGQVGFWPLTLAFCIDTTFMKGNNSWKFHDDTMTVLRAAWLQLKTITAWPVASIVRILEKIDHVIMACYWWVSAKKM